MFDVAIVGAGAAGLTSALYSLRAGFNVIVIEKGICGGQFSIADSIENYPGLENISGMELSQRMYSQVKSLGCNFLFQEVKAVKLNEDIKILKTLDKTIKSKTVIIANGLKRRKLNCKGERKFSGRGVSYCATCDGSFFKNKDVVIVGGGNTALQYAVYLSNICSKVFLVVRDEKLSTENYLIDLIKAKNNVKILFNCTVQEICGDQRKVKKVILNKNNREEEKDVEGVFVAIGYEPDNDIYKEQVNLDEEGYFESNNKCETNVNGVYVAGDCREKQLRQITTATADGAMAGTMAVNYLLKNKI